MPSVFALTRSPVLVPGGAPLDAVLAFFRDLVRPDPAAALGLIPELTKVAQQAGKKLPESTSGGAQAFRTSAKCVGEIVGAAQGNASGVIADFAKNVQVRICLTPRRCAEMLIDVVSRHARPPPRRQSPWSTFRFSPSERSGASCALRSSS